MKAIVQSGYGAVADVLRLREIRTPVPAAGEVLVRVRAASVHPDVWHVVRGWPLVLRLMGSGVRRPKSRVRGTDMAGVVESVGPGVTRFKPGDEVFGETVRGSQWKNGRAYAEFVAAPGSALAMKPANVTFEAAAVVPTAGLIALQVVQHRRGIRPGQEVLINGAAGGVGAIALQLAKAQGAVVTAVDTASKFDLLRSLGADHCIDYETEDFTRAGKRYDMVFDIPGNHPVSALRRVLIPGGVYILIAHDAYGQAGSRLLGSGIPRFLKLQILSARYSELRVRAARLPKEDSVALLADLLAAGVLTPKINRTFPLVEAAEAIHYLERGKAHGRIVLTVQDEGPTPG